MLRKIASRVEPIMRRRGWKVDFLAEFLHVQFLGTNSNWGEKISLCLRDKEDGEKFLPFEDIVECMLHELCHTAYNGHGEDLIALLNQLIRQGFTGEGFLLT